MLGHWSVDDHSAAIISIPTQHKIKEGLLGDRFVGGRKENHVGGLITFDVLEFPAHFGDAVVAAQVNPHFNRLHLHTHPSHQSQDGPFILGWWQASLSLYM